jgi:hypothetical protein
MLYMIQTGVDMGFFSDAFKVVAATAVGVVAAPVSLATLATVVVAGTVVSTAIKVATSDDDAK